MRVATVSPPEAVTASLSEGRSARMTEEYESDLDIARRLLNAKYITTEMFTAWDHHRCGWTIYRLRKEYPREQGEYHARTWYKWVQRVNEAITHARSIPPEDEETESKDRVGCTVASGSRTRHVGAPTEQKREPDKESHWPDVPRMKAYDKLDRWSRKR